MFLFIVVGVGGIGGNVARDLPKLLTNSQHRMILVDGDAVEEKNCIRQPYQKQDQGHNKARVLARKINSFYGLDCLSHDGYITNEELDVIVQKYDEYTPFFIGGVDNDNTRKLMENSYLKCNTAVYIDGANSEYEGNVYTSYIKRGRRFGKIRSDVYELQDDINPGLKGCEEQIAKGSTQFLITNQKVATCILEHIHPFLMNGYFVNTEEIKLYEGVTDIARFKELHY